MVGLSRAPADPGALSETILAASEARSGTEPADPGTLTEAILAASRALSGATPAIPAALSGTVPPDTGMLCRTGSGSVQRYGSAVVQCSGILSQRGRGMSRKPGSCCQRPLRGTGEAGLRGRSAAYGHGGKGGTLYGCRGIISSGARNASWPVSGSLQGPAADLAAGSPGCAPVFLPHLSMEISK